MYVGQCGGPFVWAHRWASPRQPQIVLDGAYMYAIYLYVRMCVMSFLSISTSHAYRKARNVKRTIGTSHACRKAQRQEDDPHKSRLSEGSTSRGRSAQVTPSEGSTSRERPPLKSRLREGLVTSRGRSAQVTSVRRLNVMRTIRTSHTVGGLNVKRTIRTSHAYWKGSQTMSHDDSKTYPPGKKLRGRSVVYVGQCGGPFVWAHRLVRGPARGSRRLFWMVLTCMPYICM